mmetsp:Transcript_41726/g.69692  ORF Transcript_41726/g.69692 Transcript_41726/m.69692 type:complete len:502 (+) Transcript_41726:1376-2881(+)
MKNICASMAACCEVAIEDENATVQSLKKEIQQIGGLASMGVSLCNKRAKMKKVQDESFTPRRSIVDCREIILSVARLSPRIRFVSSTKESMFALGDSDIIYFILENALTNALFHGMPENTVEVELTKRLVDIMITVTNEVPKGFILKNGFESDANGQIKGIVAGLAFESKVKKNRKSKIQNIQSLYDIKTRTLSEGLGMNIIRNCCIKARYRCRFWQPLPSKVSLRLFLPVYRRDPFRESKERDREELSGGPRSHDCNGGQGAKGITNGGAPENDNDYDDNNLGKMQYSPPKINFLDDSPSVLYWAKRRSKIYRAIKRSMNSRVQSMYSSSSSTRTLPGNFQEERKEDGRSKDREGTKMFCHEKNTESSFHNGIISSAPLSRILFLAKQAKNKNAERDFQIDIEKGMDNSYDNNRSKAVDCASNGMKLQKTNIEERKSFVARELDHKLTKPIKGKISAFEEKTDYPQRNKGALSTKKEAITNSLYKHKICCLEDEGLIRKM